ncbi:hypothetical protein IMCC3317_25760 [Kordia antarctica]|uniref:DNA alkylation repair enzyme n=2 Tax=Kordia antarctica TaxID=1218801 RepID=A0A7L4ZKG5_9FLAO|nr:hypothetical protein IMCC3317_25760 [Kordia antarctica]
MELWSTNEFIPRQLAILIMDKKCITEEFINQIDTDIQKHELEERNQLTDWFMANQLTKDKRIIAFIESWRKSTSVIKRRVFWYYQARLRWMGNTNHANTEDLLTMIETDIMTEQPEVQWANGKKNIELAAFPLEKKLDFIKMK